MEKADYIQLHGHQSRLADGKLLRLTVLSVTLALLLASSLAFNVLFIFQQNVQPWKLASRLPSQYAGLRYDKSTLHTSFSKYSSPLRQTQDAAWAEPDLDAWQGVVALDNTFAAERGLPPAQPWPRDQNKSVYFLSGAHQLHCVHAIREYINQNYDRVPKANQTWDYTHIVHCMNIVREGILCAADDTPLYMGKFNANANIRQHAIVGNGFSSKCRDWSAMMQWAKKNSACFINRFAAESGNLSSPERYMNCPDRA